MPQKAPTPCHYPGCGEIVSKPGFCERHLKATRKAQDERRGSPSSRGYDSKWQKARAYYLAKHPLCAEHTRQGRTVAASVVDHIVPHKGDKVKFWDSSNWQSLCKPCHDAKTVREDGGFGHQTIEKTL